jgi:NAD(P)-dependent dehydrogenase (short-subunit alcohol dehydrogenase family)
MKDFVGRVALITGGASGLGLGMAEVFAEAGMQIVIADVSAESLAAAESRLKKRGARVLALQLDVTDRVAWARAAHTVEDTFGAVHILCNNAGIGLLGSLKSARYADWDWVLGVNLGGVVNGVQTFLPRMLAHGEGGHIVSTASAAGLIAGAGAGIYTASKMAVVGLMECLRGDLAEDGIGVSVLCPHLVRTNIYQHGSLRPERFRDPEQPFTGSDPAVKEKVDAGMDPLEVGRRVLRGIERNDLYILTHPEIGTIVRERFEAIEASLPDEVPDPRRVAAEAPTLHYSVYTQQTDAHRLQTQTDVLRE